MHVDTVSESMTWRIWKLVPAETNGAFASGQSSSEPLSSGPLPPYDEDSAGQSSTRVQFAESEHGEFGAIVNEVTAVNTVTKNIITTHKRYRVEDA